MTYKRICCFTGHRPDKLPWGYNESDPACEKLKETLEYWIVKLIEYGVIRFYTGMAMGVDIWAAEIVLRMKDQYPDNDIKLIAAIPYANQTAKWNDEWKTRYNDILEQADEKILLQEEYTRGCLHARNRYMVDNSSFIIAVYNGEEGGTKYTIDYATKKGLRIKIIDPRKMN